MVSRTSSQIMVKVGAEFQVNPFTTGYQGTPAMTALSDGSPVAPTINDVTEDNNVSNEEMWAGVPIGGTAEAGSEIIIKVFSLTSPAYHEYTASATATSNGFWNHVVKEQHFSFPHGIGRIEVYAIDKAGNIGPVATHDFTMARVKPSAPEIDTISDDGIVGKEALTEGLTVSGTTDVPYLPTEVEVTFNSLTRVADVMPDGTWSVTFLPDELPLSGVHSISARTMTAAGYSVVVDTEGAAFYLEDPAAPSMDTVSGDGLISAAEKAAGITVSGSSEAGADVAVTLGGVTKTVTANGSGSWSASFASAEIPADGAHNVSAIATDAVGNTGSAATVSYTVDTTAPTAPTIDTISGDGLVSAAEKAAGITVSGSSEAGADVAVTLGGVTKTVTANGSGSWSASFASAEIPADGAHNVSAIATDAVGNTGSAATVSYTVDTTAPTAPTIDTISGDGLVSAAEKAAGITVSGSSEAGADVAVTLGGVTKTVTANGSGSWSASFASAEIPADGDHSASAAATDTLGNTGSAGEATFEVDTSAPAAPSINVISGDGLISAAEKAAGISVSGSSEAGADVAVTLGGVTKTVTANGSGSWSASFASAEIPAEGDHNVSAIATDAAGNTGSAATVSYTVDTTAPTAPTINTITGDGLIDQAENNAGINVSGTAEAGALVDITLGTSTKTVSVDGDGSWSVFFGRALIPTDGSHTATVVATDPAGNTGGETSVSFTVDTHEKIEIVFDDGGTKDIGLYETRFSDEVVIDTSNLANNDNTDSPVVLLKLNGSKYDFGFATSDEIAVIDDGIKYDVIWGSGDAWSSQRFDSDGIKFGKTRVLDDTQVADLELTSGRDINGDGIFGDEILEVLSSGQPGGVGLYDTAIDGLTIDIAELLVGDQSDSPLALVRSNGNPYTIAPLAGDVFSVLDDGVRYDVVWGQGLDWSLQRFDADGVKVGKVRAPSVERIVTLEVKFDQDINGDGTIGDEILEVLSSGQPGGVGLYDTAIDGLTIDIAELLVGDQSDSPLALVRSNGNPYTIAPLAGDVFSVLDDGVRYDVVWGQGLDWSLQRFDADGVKVGKVRAPSVERIVTLEVKFDQDINGDGTIGDEILEVLSSGQPGGVGLYDTAIDGLTIDIAELLVGDQSDSPLALVRSNGNPYTIAPLAGDVFSVLDDGVRYDVVWGQGLDWSLQRFDADGVKVGKVRAPSVERIVTLEVKFDQDINGDGTIGDEILAVLDEDALGGIGLYQTAVGGIVIDQTGLLIGDQSGSPLQLVRLNGNPYTFAFEVSDTIAVLNDGVRYNVIWGSGDNWEFQRFDTDGTKVGVRKDITQSDIYGFEEEFSQDIDDDSIIGEPVVIAILSAEISNQVAILENSFFELA